MTDFMQESDSIEGMLSYLTEELVAELIEAYPDINLPGASELPKTAGSHMELRQGNCGGAFGSCT